MPKPELTKAKVTVFMPSGKTWWTNAYDYSQELPKLQSYHISSDCTKLRLVFDDGSDMEFITCPLQSNIQNHNI